MDLEDQVGKNKKSNLLNPPNLLAFGQKYNVQNKNMQEIERLFGNSTGYSAAYGLIPFL